MTEIGVIHGDVTRLEVDAIVNAANARLIPGGGVDGAIHSAGGPAIAQQCWAIDSQRGGLATGEAVVTTAGRLPARHVIHTVGPIWGQVRPERAVRLLGSCYENSLDLAVANDCRTVAFPNISTGVYGFPQGLAAETAIASVANWVDSDPGSLDSITFVCFEEANYKIYRDLLGP